MHTYSCRLPHSFSLFRQTTSRYQKKPGLDRLEIMYIDLRGVCSRAAAAALCLTRLSDGLFSLSSLLPPSYPHLRAVECVRRRQMLLYARRTFRPLREAAGCRQSHSSTRSSSRFLRNRVAFGSSSLLLVIAFCHP